MTISFLSLFFPSFFSRKNPLLPSSIDASWMETLGGKGFLGSIGLLKFHALRAYYLHFWVVIFISIFLVLLVLRIL
jgi:hypothetical protein